ncbi:hypothetical protein PGT21_011289 [Puccinia graminis f. sp. tritici]|uniref:Uncharacterized protein n=1 Tax=Puccinia graminis f. sp. tritici TaxID=56615 RepID=A0A5B0Q3A1_PUCGR|nr:hypothetical protein PGT21_011289 [Puccinia graminis f. sp. tritici]
MRVLFHGKKKHSPTLAQQDGNVDREFQFQPDWSRLVQVAPTFLVQRWANGVTGGRFNLRQPLPPGPNVRPTEDVGCDNQGPTQGWLGER